MLFVKPVALPDDLKHTEATFLLVSTDSLHLQIARSQDLVIFVLMTDDRQNQLFYPLHMCAE